MIVVRVELHSAITHQVTELARMHICNNATEGNPRRGNYTGQSFIGRDSVALDRQTVSKVGVVRDWRRLDFHVWNLVRAMLTNMGYTNGQAS